MKQALKPVWAIFFVLLAVTTVSLVVRNTRAPEIIPWRPAYAAALDEARTSGKRTLLYFTASWCGPCQEMKHTTWADKGVEAALRDYVPVKVDIDEHPDLARKYNVDGIPAYVLLDPGGNTLRTSSGAMPPGEFVAWLRS